MALESVEQAIEHTTLTVVDGNIPDGLREARFRVTSY